MKKKSEGPPKKKKGDYDGLPVLVTLNFFLREEQIVAQWIQGKAVDQEILITIAAQLNQIRDKILADAIKSSYLEGYKKGREDQDFEVSTSNNRFTLTEN